jgi:hypothetical protein
MFLGLLVYFTVAYPSSLSISTLYSLPTEDDPVVQRQLALASLLRGLGVAERRGGTADGSASPQPHTPSGGEVHGTERDATGLGRSEA